MVHLRRGFPPDEIEGTLTVDGTGLLFEREDGGTTRMAFTEVLGARRVRGSPILMLRWRRDGERRETAFYFAQPPPLGPLDGRAGAPAGAPPSATSMFRRTTKRKQRRDNTSYLSTLAGSLRPLIDDFVEEVRSGIEAAKPPDGT
jgi:hypothetical protein